MESIRQSFEFRRHLMNKDTGGEGLKMGEESIRMWLEEADGREREYEAVGTFALEERDYMALRPVEDGEDGQVILVGFHGDEEDRLILDPIEDEDEYELAAEVFEALFNGEAEIETDYPEDFWEAFGIFGEGQESEEVTASEDRANSEALTSSEDRSYPEEIRLEDTDHE